MCTEPGVTWLAVDRLDTTLSRVPDDQSWLDPTERERLVGMQREARRAQFLAGRWLLREVLSRTGGLGPPHRWRLCGTAGQAPCVLASPAGPSADSSWFLALSHSGDHVAAAASTSPIGLDIETIRPRGDLAGLAALACTAAEQNALSVLDDAAREVRFYTTWSVKEAWIKRWGGALTPARLQQIHARPAVAGEMIRARACHSPAWALALCSDDATLGQLGALPAPHTEWAAWAIDDDDPLIEATGPDRSAGGGHQPNPPAPSRR